MEQERQGRGGGIQEEERALPAAADDDDFLEERLMAARLLPERIWRSASLSLGCFPPARGGVAEFSAFSALVWVERVRVEGRGTNR